MIERGQENTALARYAATQGMVLLKNEGAVLPLGPERTKVAVFGIGQIHTFKGGTGSGDVNNRETISILRGLREDPAFLVDEQLAASYENWAATNPAVYEYAVCRTASYPELPVEEINWDAASDNDAAIVVLSRTSGEDSDRTLTMGDYYITAVERELLEKVNSMFEKSVVLLNTCGIIDLKDVVKNCKALLYISMPGQEGGRAVADILSGTVTPSGKLTDTWAVNWMDYPSSSNFGAVRRNGNWNYKTHGRTAEGGVEQAYVEYQEGIYNGYRYFDTFGVPAAFPFGYGLSYTNFSLTMTGFSYEKGELAVKCLVANLGDTHAGREVVQVYVSAPDGEMEKPFRELKGFAKTRLLQPSATEEVCIRINTADLASYNEQRSMWVLEPGYYDVYVGNSLTNAAYAGTLAAKAEIIVSRNRALAGRQHMFPLLSKCVSGVTRREPDRSAAPVCTIDPEDIETVTYTYSVPSTRAAKQAESGPTWQDVMENRATTHELVAQMDVAAMADMVCGIGMDLFKMNNDFAIGNLDNGMVPGCAGMTKANQTLGIPAMVLADGPAGLRIHRDVKDENGQVVLHQNCTAYPVGTLLASSWDEELLRQVGRAVGEEMRLFNVDLWLAPGMNIHRNPLCGRNFEYYSEDPLLTGRMATAITQGVQSMGVGVTIKHMAVNNQESLRANSDSRLDERTLREIYLRGFAIAIREAQPWAVMTSYNDINGIPAADSFDLCTGFARDECGLEGLIMTDWGGGLSLAPLSIRAGNDMIQPGGWEEVRTLTAWCDRGELVRSKGEAHITGYMTRAMLEDCLARCLNVVKKAQLGKRT